MDKKHLLFVMEQIGSVPQGYVKRSDTQQAFTSAVGHHNRGLENTFNEGRLQLNNNMDNYIGPDRLGGPAILLGRCIKIFAALFLGLNACHAIAEPVVWIADDVTKEIYEVELDGTFVSSFPSDVTTTGTFRIFPSDIALDATNDSLWVVTETPPRLINYNKAGQQIDLIDRQHLEAFGVDGSEGVAIDSNDGSIWIVDEASIPTIYHFEWTGTVLNLLDSFPMSIFDPANASPQGITVDPFNGTLWIIDNRTENIYNISTSGVLIETIPVSAFSIMINPNQQSLSVDTRNGTLWVSERNTETGDSLIYNIELLGNGSVQVLSTFPTIAYNPLSMNPSGIAFDDSANSDTILFDVDFSEDEQGFQYRDDTFSNTNAPFYESGRYLADGGFTGGGLETILGGINNSYIFGMSGGWSKSFDLAVPKDVTLTFRYNLTQASNYESDEFSDVRVSVDGNAVGLNGQNYIARIVGNGNGGSARSTGWVLAEVNLGTLPAGAHSVTLGGYNNKKTYSNEVTSVLLDDINAVGKQPDTSGGIISENHFDTDSEGYVYADDTFRNSNNGRYARGKYKASGGLTGGGLQVRLGGINNNDIFGISGGWTQSFVVDSTRQVSVTFRYRLVQTPNYESDEYSEVLVVLNGGLIGGAQGDGVMARITGNGNGGPYQSTGWATATIDLGVLSPGTINTFTIGAYNNKKTYYNEWTDLRIDDVIISDN